MQVDTTKYRAAINQLLQAVQMKEWSMVDSAANALNFLPSPSDGRYPSTPDARYASIGAA